MTCQLNCPKTGSACDNMDAVVVCAWNKALLTGLNAGSGTPGDAIASASAAHWDALGMDETLKPFVGNPEAFYQFLHDAWNWIVTPDADGRGLTADENKTACVCPLVRAGAADAPILCRCSESFTSRMFSVVMQRPVRATVLESILRGGKHCVYRIEWE